jgi:hypothetical protein
MAVLITGTSLTTKDGGTVPAGAFGKFEVQFPMDELVYDLKITFWRDKQSKDNGLRPIKINEIPKNFYRKKLTMEEYGQLTPILIHDDVKEFLEFYIGDNTVKIVLDESQI